MCYEHKIAFYIWNVFSPILLVFGTIGNLLTLFILVQRKNRNFNIAKYLTGLAVSDLVVLWTSVPRNWLQFGYGIDIRSMSPLICKVQVYLLHLCSTSSLSFVLILTIERFIFTWLPMKAKRICTTRKANIVIFSLLTFLVVMNTHFLYGMGYTEKNNCYPIDDSYANFYFYIWPKIMSASTLISFTILGTVNISIIIQVSIIRRKTQAHMIPQSLTTAARERKAQNTRLTAMLITLNVVYMICVIPFMVFLAFHSDWRLSHGNEHSDAVLELIWAIVNALFRTNNAVNCILYFLSGSAFRKEVTEIVYPMLHSCRAICQWEHSLESIVYVHAHAPEGNVEQ